MNNTNTFLNGFKRLLKTVMIGMLVLLIVIVLIGLIFFYETRWRLRDVGTEVSTDGRYRIVFQEIGEPDWPFGNAHARITVYDNGETIEKFDEDISDDGGSFDQSNYSVQWQPDKTIIIFSGEEQEDHLVEIPLK